jgi:hypothetical protein
VPQHEHLAIGRRQRCHRLAHVMPLGVQLDRIKRRARLRLIAQRLQPVERDRATQLPAPQARIPRVARDAIEPRGEGCVALELVQALERREKGVLGQIASSRSLVRCRR